MQIGPARRGDVEAIISGLPDRTCEQHLGRLRYQQQGDGVYLIAWHRGVPVGHVVLKWPWWPERYVSEMTARYGCSWVEDLAVQRDHRNRGIGRALMLQLEQLTRTHRLKRVGLAVGLDEGYAAARHLYDSLGYRDPGHGPYFESAAIRGRGVWMDWVEALIKQLD